MIEFINVSKKFNDLEVLKNFNIKFKKDKITCLFGPSGIGKTTIANIAANLTEIDNGEVKGTENAIYSFVFQEPRLLEWYSVYNNIDFVLKNVYDYDKRVNIINNYINMVELKEFENYKPNELSSGMAQRVSLARAFAYPSNVLILDEPFKGLDLKLKREMITMFKRFWNESKRTVIFITHDVDEAVTLSDFICVLNEKPAKVIDYIDILEYNDMVKVKYLLDI